MANDLAAELDDIDGAITEDWLRRAGFRWHEMERQNAKHWLLWIGDAIDSCRTCIEDLGVELAPGAYMGADQPAAWFCWLRADTAHRYGRFIHVRHLRTRRDLLGLLFGLVGREFRTDETFGGMWRRPGAAERIRRDFERTQHRLDQQLLRSGHPWSERERDPDRGRPLLDHVDAAIAAGKAK